MGASWQADAPPGLEIIAAGVSLYSQYVNDGSAGQYGGAFYWDGGGGSEITPGESVFFTPPGFASSTFGFWMVCGVSICTQARGNITVNSAGLVVQETSGPSVSGSPEGLWGTTKWVRGEWPLYWDGASPSGICSLSASLAGQALQSETVVPDQDLWKQCQIPYGQWTGDEVFTNEYPNGADKLAIGGTDAAGESASTSETVHIDNQQPTVSLSGPTDAPSTAGTQYVTATATAGPSGVAGMDCSLDGAAAQWFPGASARIAVTGVGEHSVRCYSESNAVDTSGNPGLSAPQTFEMKIGVPTVAAIAFDRVADELQCHKTRNGATRCHPVTKLVKRVVTVRVRRHGRIAHVRRVEKVRIVVLPHLVQSATRTVGFGESTTVNGWLGTYTGSALAGQPVEILTAPDDGSDAFTPLTSTTTQPDGSWSATVPPGPSRLIEASYPGAPTTESSTSTLVHELVPADVQLLSVKPHDVAWGHTVRIVGRLVGGYLPAGGALVRLRIGLGSAHTTYGVHEHVVGDGQFATTYTFGAGQSQIFRRFWFQVASLPMGDYPYAPANSRRVYVVVGGHPGRHH